MQEHGVARPMSGEADRKIHNAQRHWRRVTRAKEKGAFVVVISHHDLCRRMRLATCDTPRVSGSGLVARFRSRRLWCEAKREVDVMSAVRRGHAVLPTANSGVAELIICAHHRYRGNASLDTCREKRIGGRMNGKKKRGRDVPDKATPRRPPSLRSALGPLKFRGPMRSQLHHHTFSPR